MKRVLFFIFFFVAVLFSATAQDCALIKNEDPYTRSITYSTGYNKWPGGSVVLDASKAEIDWMIELGVGNICVDDEATIQVFFEGSKLRLMFRNSGTMNCEGLLHVLFKNSTTTNYQLNKLATLPIQRILITTSAKKEFSIEPDADQRAVWMRSATCLIDRGKQLLTQ
jgi:hypothetical protein